VPGTWTVRLRFEEANGNTSFRLVKQ